MKLNCAEKKTLLENLTNRMIRIEQAIGSIKFYEKASDAKRLPKDGSSSASGVKTVEGREEDYLNKPIVSFDGPHDNDGDEHHDDDRHDHHGHDEGQRAEPSREDEEDYNEIKSRLENVPTDLLGTHKDEMIELIKKHGHKNSVAVHICTIKLILQQIAKEFLQDIYAQYNDFYIYIHSNSILDVYNTFEYKRNIILSHLDFMKTYSQQVQKILQLKENINSYKMSEAELHLERLQKIEQKNEALFSRISAVNVALEDVACKYALMMQAASLIVSRQKPNVS
ncbi:hypothetical protein C922_03565 [Plasmodium inui San Antonio 1]|uniref:Uncharacterized protein n=1 Tax=Plasmodium inui San Antonio 1 TaxID=1237626 RepID=W7A367_9APIC|nr:hypothetical protein C922_03565 [Plasmodium inui San Antonio 1]EUD66095.1 hypothetical protein C922_03565 [Plasmodium inui San Antonio 1]